MFRERIPPSVRRLVGSYQDADQGGPVPKHMNSIQMKATKAFGPLGLIVSALAFTGGTAGAVNSFVDVKDLVMHFQKAGNSNTVYVGLGSAPVLYRGSAAGATADRNALNIININDTLTNAFGPGWASDPDIYVGAVAARSASNNTNSTGTVIDGDMARTVYASRSRPAVGTVGSAEAAAWDFTLSGASTTAATNIVAVINNFRQNTTALSEILGTSTSIIDDQNPFLAPGIQGTAYGSFPGGIQQVGSASSFGSLGEVNNIEFALDLFRILPVDTGTLSAAMQAVVTPGPNRVGSFEGTLVLDSSGNVSFLTVPEPSSALLAGLAGLGLALRRRRNA